MAGKAKPDWASMRIAASPVTVSAGSAKPFDLAGNGLGRECRQPVYAMGRQAVAISFDEGIGDGDGVFVKTFSTPRNTPTARS